MTWQQIVVAILLTIGVAIQLACCLGVLVMTNVFDRLHYLAPATTLGSAAIVAAVLIQEGLGQPGIKALLIGAMLLGASPILAHATARAARRRAHGDWTVGPDEEVERL